MQIRKQKGRPPKPVRSNGYGRWSRVRFMALGLKPGEYLVVSGLSDLDQKRLAVMVSNLRRRNGVRGLTSYRHPTRKDTRIILKEGK